MASPCFTVPLPTGRPRPSGRTSVSHALISSGSAGRPSPSFAAVLTGSRAAICWATPGAIEAMAALQPSAARMKSLADLDILRLTVRVHQPGLNAVVVIDRVDAADLAQFVLARLHVAGGIDGPRLDHHFLAVPVEIDIEPRHRFIEHRPIEAGGLPVAAAVDRYVDARDAAAPGPRQAAQH